MIHCREDNLNYIYSPLKSVEHNYDNDSNYINKLENLMNLKDNIQNQSETLLQEIKFGDIRNNFEQNIDNYCNSETMKFIKECFWKNKERDHFKNNKLKILFVIFCTIVLIWQPKLAPITWITSYVLLSLYIHYFTSNKTI